MSFSKNAIAIALALACAGANAAASGSVVFDPSNFAKNTATSMATARQVVESITQTAKQIQMVKEQVMMGKQMIDNIRGLNVKELLRMSSPQLDEIIRDLRGAEMAYRDVQGNLTYLRDRYKTKLEAASRDGKSLANYTRAQIREAIAGNRDAQIAIERDIGVLRGTQQSARNAESWREKIHSISDNLGGAMQLLNTQMTSVVSGNAELLGYMARVNAEEKRAQAQAADRAIDEAEVFSSGMEALEEKRRQAVRKSLTEKGGEFYNPWEAKK